MKIKKFISLALILTLFGFFPFPVYSTQDNEQTLYQFIKENKEFNASFEYPSYIAILRF